MKVRCPAMTVREIVGIIVLLVFLLAVLHLLGLI